MCWVCSCPPDPNTDSGSYECNWMALGEIVWFSCCFPVVFLQQQEQWVYPTFLSPLTENRPVKSERRSVELCKWIKSSICDSIVMGTLLFLHVKSTITQSLLALVYFLRDEKWVLVITPLTVTPGTKAVSHHQQLSDGSRQEQTDGEIPER